MTEQELEKLQDEIEGWSEEHKIEAGEYLVKACKKILDCGLPHTETEQRASKLLMGIEGAIIVARKEFEDEKLGK